MVTCMERGRWLVGFAGALTIALAFCPAGLNGAAQRGEEAAEITALKKRVAEQDRRISELERELKMLLAASTQPPVHVKQTPVKRSQSIQASTVSAQAGVLQPVAKPPGGPTNPKISIAGINVAGDVYLYQYAPNGVLGAEPRFELYAFSALLDGQRGHWGFHSDYRLRTTKLRSFYPGSTWLQQGYVRYRTPYGEFRAGSFYRRVGIEWDDSFFGNIEYFDGLKLDPEFGLGFEGAHDFSKRWSAEYSAQYFSTDARINGSLPGRDFVSESAAHAKNDVTLRLAPVFHFGSGSSLTIGGSVAQGAIDRDSGPNNLRDQEAVDITLQKGPWLAYGELLTQKVHGRVVLPPQNATYTLAGVRWTRGRYQPRFNFSQGNYFGLNARREYILQPGITIRLADGFYFIYEYDFWQKLAMTNRQVLDRSSNLVLQYHF